MPNQEIKIKSKASLADAIRHLESLVMSLKEGRLCIRKNDESISLTPQDPVLFELEAKVKLTKGSLKELLSIELKWKKGDHATPEGDVFTISHLEAKPES